MTLGTLSGITTLLSLLAFLGVAYWAYDARRRDAFDRAARIPLEEHAARIPLEEHEDRSP